jgi:hypothetical protein
MNKYPKKKIASENIFSEAINNENKYICDVVESNIDKDTDELVDSILKEHNIEINEDLQYKNYIYDFLKYKLSKDQIDKIYNCIKYNNFELWLSLNKEYNIIVKLNDGTCYLIQLLKLYNDFMAAYQSASFNERDRMSNESITYYILIQKRYYTLSDIVTYRTTDSTGLYYLKLLITYILYEFKKFRQYIKDYKI